MAYYQQALKNYRTLPGTQRDQADCFNNMGAALETVKKFDEAANQYQQALALFQSVQGTERDQADCRTNLGLMLGLLHKYDEAILQHQQALKLFQGLQDTGLEQASCYGNLGSTLEDQGKYEEALTPFRQALRLFQSLHDSVREQAICYKNIGEALEKLKRYGESISPFQQALKLYLGLPESESEQARCHLYLGEALACLGQHREAIAQQLQAIKYLQALPGTECGQAACYLNIGVAQVSLGKYEEALKQTLQALKLYQAFRGTEHERAACFQNLGVALGNLSKYEESMEQQRQALKLYQSLKGTEREQALCCQNLAVALGSLGQSEESIALQRQTLALYQTLPNSEFDQASCCQSLGVVLKDSGLFEEAISVTQQALKLYQSIQGTERQRAICSMNLGVIYVKLGQLDEAVAQQQQSLKLYTSLQGTEREQANCCMDLGLALRHLGHNDEAMAWHRKALALFKTLQGTEREQAGCFVNFGLVLLSLSKNEEAIEQLQTALALFKKCAGNQRDQLLCQGLIGLSHLGANRFSDAIASFGQAGEKHWTCQGLGQAYRRRGQPGDPALALNHLLRATELVESERAGILAKEHREGVFEQTVEVFPELTGLLAEQAGLLKMRDDPRIAQWALDPQSASAGLEAAFHFADQGKGRSLNDALRERSTLKTARADTRLLAEDKELSQRISKLTTLRDALPEAHVEQKTTLTHSLEELQQRRNMIEVGLKKTALGHYVAPEFSKPLAIAAELEPGTAVLQYSVGEKEVWLILLTQGRVTAHKLGCETPALPELRPLQSTAIGQLVEAWQVRPNTLGLEGLVILARERAADLGRSPKQNLLDTAQEQAILQRLGALVLPATALAELRQNKIKHLLMIPDRSLHYLPFAMLRITAENGLASHYLLEEFSVSYTPAMTTLETIRKQTQAREQSRRMARRHLLAFANPAYGAEGVATVPAQASGDTMITRMRKMRSDYYSESGLRLTSLPETEQEALRVASLFGPPTCVRAEAAAYADAAALVLASHAASEDQVKRLLGPRSDKTSPSWQYLLFSTHGLADPQNGMLSCIALSAPSGESAEDGFLQAQEVLDLELDADLVMLSACQTGLGRMRGGEGLVGLCGAFFVAGAESVCASLWSVPSDPTGQLVTEFFKGLKSGTMNRAEALRQAQLTVLRSGQTAQGKPADYSSPFCWAAFVLAGEYRAERKGE